MLKIITYSPFMPIGEPLIQIVHAHVVDDEIVARRSRSVKLRDALPRHAVVALPLGLGRKEDKLLDLRDRFALALPHLRPMLLAVDEERVAVRLPQHAEDMERGLVELH